MHVESSDPAPFHLRIHSPVLPSSPQFRSELIALTRRCITRCVRFPVRFVFVASTRVYSAVSFTPALRLRSLPHLSCVFIVFSFFSSTPALCSPARPFPSSPCAPQRPELLRSHDLRQRHEPAYTRIPHYTSVPLRCRCHVTRTNWSRAFSASRLVAQ